MTPYSYSIVSTGGPSAASGASVTVAATSASSAITIGHNQLVRIASTGPVNIRFGSGLTTANANDVYLSGSVSETFDLGRGHEQILFYNPGATSVIVNYSIISRT